MHIFSSTPGPFAAPLSAVRQAAQFNQGRWPANEGRPFLRPASTGVTPVQPLLVDGPTLPATPGVTPVVALGSDEGKGVHSVDSPCVVTSPTQDHGDSDATTAVTDVVALTTAEGKGAHSVPTPSVVPSTTEAASVGSQAWDLLQRDGEAASIERTAAELGVDPQTVLTATASHIRDLALIQETIRTNPAGVRELAEAIRAGQSRDDRYAEGYADGMRRVLAARPAGCPSFCTDDHRGHVDVVDGFSIGLCHEVVVLDLTAEDPAWSGDRPATARVLVESTTERGEVITPARVVLSIAEGAEGHYVGSADVQGWSGTPAEVEQLAHALLSAARIARHA